MAIQKKRAVVAQHDCVACGSCMTVCPMDAITIYRGSFAEVETGKCVGCGKCVRACPASVIRIEVTP